MAPDGDYAGYTEVLPGGGKGYETYIVGAYGSDFAVGSTHFGLYDHLVVQGINDSDVVVGYLQRSGAANPVPWWSRGAGSLQQLGFPASVLVPQGFFGRLVRETLTGGEALGINDEAIVNDRYCNPTVVAAQGDKFSEDDEGHPPSGKVLIAKDVTGPDGETLRDGDDLCGGENGAVLEYQTDIGSYRDVTVGSYHNDPEQNHYKTVIDFSPTPPPSALAQFKLTVAPDGALAATIANLPASSEVGDGGAIVPSKNLHGLDLIDDPAANIDVFGAILGTELRLDVGGGVARSAALPEAGASPDISSFPGVQPAPACSAGHTAVVTGVVNLAATTFGCPIALNGAILYGTGPSTEIDGGIRAVRNGSSRTVVTSGPLTVRGPTRLVTPFGPSSRQWRAAVSRLSASPSPLRALWRC